MTGREELDLKNEKWISQKLNDCPQILCDYMESNRHSKTSMSRRNYLGYLIQFISFLSDNDFNVNDVNIYREIKPININKYMEHISYRVVKGVRKENKVGIRIAKFYAVSDFFEFLLNNDYIDKNPCKKIELPKDNEIRSVVSMSQTDIETVENNIINRGEGRCKKYNLRDLCIIKLGISTGLRVSAIASINIQDINFDDNSIVVTEKGNIKRKVYIGNNTKNILLDWIGERSNLIGNHKTDALFISKNKERISTVSIRKMLQKETANLDKHITPHKMRSTCATNLYEKTGDIYLVQEQLGHSNIANTRRYAKVSTERMVKASNILDELV